MRTETNELRQRFLVTVFRDLKKRVLCLTHSNYFVLQTPKRCCGAISFGTTVRLTEFIFELKFCVCISIQIMRYTPRRAMHGEGE